MRSGKHNLNELLKQKLGNFVAFEPIELPAESFALAALGEATLGLFKVGDRQLRVIKHHVEVGDYRFANLPVYKLHKESHRLLQYFPAAHADLVQSHIKPSLHPNDFHSELPLSNLARSEVETFAEVFYQWAADTRIQPGDTLIYKALCVYALSAAAFAGAAFGENILSLFRLANQTILVTEYRIEATHTLHGKLLAQVAYGYGVVPIAYRSHADAGLKLMPADDIRLQVGDRLIVLATIHSLQKIEWGTPTPPRHWQLQALKPLNAGATYYAGNTLKTFLDAS